MVKVCPSAVGMTGCGGVTGASEVTGCGVTGSGRVTRVRVARAVGVTGYAKEFCVLFHYTMKQLVTKSVPQTLDCEFSNTPYDSSVSRMVS